MRLGPETHPFHIPGVSILAAPDGRNPVEVLTLSEAERRLGRTLSRAAMDTSLLPGSPVIMDNQRPAVYPIIHGVPVLLEPERLDWNDSLRGAERQKPLYREAYEEMSFYNRAGLREASSIGTSQSYKAIAKILRTPAQDRGRFPDPGNLWLDAVYDCKAQYAAYKFLSISQSTRRVLQVGGKGIHAVKFALAGTAEAWLVTPVPGEALCGLALAEAAGVADRFRCVVGIGEKLPFCDNAFDALYSGGCLHHMVADQAAQEWARVLGRNGRCAAADPWRTPLYRMGIAVFGKREPEVHCKPLTNARVESFFRTFPEACVSRHGALTRYPLLALKKLGFAISLEWSFKITTADDKASSILRLNGLLGSSGALCGAVGSSRTSELAANA